ncbi:hydroxymethylglutaryl-CoA lyase [Amphiplicatus metriothermophilus]|uniref:hydroxymethylglutaryl-CoA lyase n=1 Tax=Amphiplicatus metriothermophilus TaxID=1519374 RepID=A0A239PIJ0_9PROT|nr:hydroxymethylglutaryl-CoA lyase [Amphiplicatus metriothermophilus]MBB5518060.1 hydroxymethylglutaryl-CoA lyase [Amphiplicatus metriothermophilus]SNT67606.1 hydroxymethylglutaryl-CoA lyase [Amphiplicatus metriothermophilus]
MSERIVIVEVGPRDGLQNEKQSVDVETKVALIERLAAAGCPVVEAGAFVSPKWTPQMAASDQVMARMKRRAGASYPALVPNMKGYEGARAARADTIAVFAAASETFSQRNINCSIAESLERFRPVMEAARADGIRVRGYVSCVLGCPYEGKVPLAAVVKVAKALYDMGCYEISLGDTIGVGTAGEARAMIRAVAGEIPVAALAGHYHDTYGQALANIWASIEEGARVFDSSVSGLGGCPYAPGAAGNVATEDVAYMLAGSGFETGIDLDALVETSLWISRALGRAPGSKVARALAAKCARDDATERSAS